MVTGGVWGQRAHRVARQDSGPDYASHDVTAPGSERAWYRLRMYDKISSVSGGSFETTLQQLARRSIGKERPRETIGLIDGFHIRVCLCTCSPAKLSRALVASMGQSSYRYVY